MRWRRRWREKLKKWRSIWMMSRDSSDWLINFTLSTSLVDPGTRRTRQNQDVPHTHTHTHTHTYISFSQLTICYLKKVICTFIRHFRLFSCNSEFISQKNAVKKAKIARLWTLFWLSRNSDFYWILSLHQYCCCYCCFLRIGMKNKGNCVVLSNNSNCIPRNSEMYSMAEAKNENKNSQLHFIYTILYINLLYWNLQRIVFTIVFSKLYVCMYLFVWGGECILLFVLKYGAHE